MIKDKLATVFSHYDKHNIVDDYVVFYLRKLREVSEYLVFVSTSEIQSSDNYKCVCDICDDVVVKENVGYDFMSYKIGYQKIKGLEFDKLVFCNDSVYGPFYPLDKIFKVMDRSDCDFWGMTFSRHISYHLQSYFIVFDCKKIRLSDLEEFMDGVKVYKNKEDIIKKCEIRLTRFFVERGFSPKAYVDYSPRFIEVMRVLIPAYIKGRLRRDKVRHAGVQLDSTGFFTKVLKVRERVNMTHIFWRDIILKHGMPFLKVELLRDNPCGMNLDKVEETLNNLPDYDGCLVENHLRRVRP